MKNKIKKNNFLKHSIVACAFTACLAVCTPFTAQAVKTVVNQEDLIINYSSQEEPIVSFPEGTYPIIETKQFAGTTTTGVILPANSIVMCEAFSDSELKFVYVGDDSVLGKGAFAGVDYSTFTVFTEDTAIAEQLRTEYSAEGLEVVIPSIAGQKEYREYSDTCSGFFVLPNVPDVNIYTTYFHNNNILIVPPLVEYAYVENIFKIYGLYVMDGALERGLYAGSSLGFDWIRVQGAMDFLQNLEVELPIIITNEENQQLAKELFPNSNVFAPVLEPGDYEFGELGKEPYDPYPAYVYERKLIELKPIEFPFYVGIRGEYNQFVLRDLDVTVNARKVNYEKGEVTVEVGFPFNETSVTKEFPIYTPTHYKEVSYDPIVEDSAKNVEMDSMNEVGESTYTSFQPEERKQSILLGKRKKFKETTQKKEKAVAKFTIGQSKYRVIGKTTVSFTGIQDKTRKSISIPETVTFQDKVYRVEAIWDGAFQGCKNLTTVLLGEHVKSIGKNAFRNCKALKRVLVQSTNLESVGKNAFKKTNKELRVIVPQNQLKTYKKLLKNKGNKKLKVF